MPAAARAGWGGEDSHMQCKDNHYFVDNNIMSGFFYSYPPNGHSVLAGFCQDADGPVSVCLAAIRKYILPERVICNKTNLKEDLHRFYSSNQL